MITKSRIGLAVIGLLVGVLLLGASLPPSYDAIPKIDIPESKTSILRSVKRWEETRNTKAVARLGLEAPLFYVASGQYTAENKEVLQSQMHHDAKYLFVFRALDADWEDVYSHILPSIPDAVCVMDYKPGEFDGPMIEEFVRESGATEIVLSWGLANAIEHPELLAEMAKDVEGALEYAKRGNPNVFVWVTVCYAIENTMEWSELIKNLPFDGVAVWNIHTLPEGWEPEFLNRPLKWAQDTFNNRPVSLAGLYGAKVWVKNSRKAVLAMRNRIQIELPKAIVETHRLGYAAIWIQEGIIPGGIHEACNY